MWRWMYQVTYTDPRSGVTVVEQHPFPESAHSQAERKRREGFTDVRITQRRCLPFGHGTSRKPGVY